ncbi:MAG: hypothetical protein EBQ96_03390 [Proteobacteria bacterium]|nr:hypothetical protein [Pseudomonadota bacterium]
MADNELPQIVLDFRALSKGIADMQLVLDAVSSGKLVEFSANPEAIFGDIPADVQVDEARVLQFVDTRMETCSAKCIDATTLATEGEIATLALFKATSQHAQATGAHFTNNDQDQKQAEARLARLSIMTDEYKERPWDDKDAVSEARETQEQALITDYINELQQGTPQYALRIKILEDSSSAYLKAGLARVEAAQILMAGELLRIRSHVDTAQAVLENGTHKAALDAVTRNLQWAGTLLQNADEASPHLRRRWSIENDDNDNGTPPPTQKLN